MSQRLMRFLSAILATVGMTLLLIDSEVFTRFHLHLNPIVWELVINPDQNETARDWQLMFISVPVILLIEMLFATGAGKTAQPDPPTPLREARRRALLRLLYQFAHHVYLGGCELLSSYYYAAREPAALVPDDGPSLPRETWPA